MRLSIENLVVDRGSKRVLDGLSLSAKSGEAVVLSGPNGSGKTTLLRTLAGLITPLSGSFFAEENGQTISLEKNVHYVGHLNALKDTLTVEENLSFWARYLAETVPHPISSVLQAFDLERLRTIPVAYLSAGQKRRACLARVLVWPRPIWLLDEPTVSLDSESVKVLTHIIETHLQSGGLVLASSHIPLGLAQEQKFTIENRRGAFS